MDWTDGIISEDGRPVGWNDVEPFLRVAG